jgi:hypothetical protein
MLGLAVARRERKSLNLDGKRDARRRMSMTDAEPVSWRALLYGTRILAADGQLLGTVREVLGSDSEDIFHGLRVRLDGQKRDVMIPADRLGPLSDAGVPTDLTRGQATALPDYDDEATYHLASVGWLRKHLGWRRDSASDEEAG